jgi:hypothetical protein
MLLCSSTTSNSSSKRIDLGIFATYLTISSKALLALHPLLVLIQSEG